MRQKRLLWRSGKDKLNNGQRDYFGTKEKIPPPIPETILPAFPYAFHPWDYDRNRNAQQEEQHIRLIPSNA